MCVIKICEAIFKARKLKMHFVIVIYFILFFAFFERSELISFLLLADVPQR